jgi:hypothetical protein
MEHLINDLASRLEQKNLKPRINLERPLYVQPEDRIIYRSTRIILILGMLNTSNGLSKEVIACIDFLLRNSGYQKKFIIEYFKGTQPTLSKKLLQYAPSENIEIDFNIVQYKSVPWDLRFNDMFLFLLVRNFVVFKGIKPNTRILITEKGIEYFNSTKDIFIDEVNFLELFGKRLTEDKAKTIITEVIPNSYWRDNEKLDYQ